MNSDLIHNSAVELATAIAAGEVRSTEVVSAHLDRIDEVNSEVNAIVSMRSRDEIMIDAELADSSDVRGPLHGLPIAVKDLEDVAGLPTRAGSLVSSDQPVESDSYVATKLLAAGAAIIGKTNTPEFGTHRWRHSVIDVGARWPRHS